MTDIIVEGLNTETGKTEVLLKIRYKTLKEVSVINIKKFHENIKRLWLKVE